MSYCLMTNHFHLVARPADEASAAKALGRLEADYARYLHVRRRTSGHLWQARYYSVPMDPSYCWRAIAYVERNPVRAGMAATAAGYRWSSAAARTGLAPPEPWLELCSWRQQWSTAGWRAFEADREAEALLRAELREATLSGFPLGADLVQKLEQERHARLHRGKAGRPRAVAAAASQSRLF
jgi:putative transposase